MKKLLSLILAFVFVAGIFVSVPVNSSAANAETLNDANGETATPHTHFYTVEVTKEATCAEDGEIVYKCTCGDVHVESIAASGHSYDEGVVVKNPSYEEDGAKVFTCSVCGGFYTEAIPKKIRFAPPEIESIVAEASVLRITWKQVEGVEGYILYKLVDGEYQQIAVQASTNTTYFDKRVVEGETYKYALASMDRYGFTGDLNEFSFEYITPIVLEKPVVTPSNTPEGIVVAWEPVENAESYTVYRRVYNETTKKYSSWTAVATGYTDTTYLDEDVVLNTIYSYTARAVNGKVRSEYKAATGLRYKVTPTVTATNVANGIKVSWTTVANATGYTVYSSTYNATTKKWSSWKNCGTAGAAKTSWVDKNVKSGTQYRYTVKAKYEKIASPYNKTGAKSIFLTQPTVKYENTRTGIKVTWNKITGAKNYTVYKAEYTNGKWSAWKNVGTCGNSIFGCVDVNVEAGKMYRYTVRAVNGSSRSSYATLTGNTFLLEPTVTVATSKNGIKVNWTKSLGAKNYAVYRSENVDGKWTSWFRISTTTALDLTDGDAIKGIKYRYAVRALNGASKSTYKASSTINGCVTSGSQSGITNGSAESTPDPIINDPFGTFQTAANNINQKGVAGYSKKTWQSVGSVELDKADFLASTFSELIDGYMVKEADAEVKVNVKGSANAMDNMPPSDCSKACVKSAKAEKQSNGNYVITIVMADEVNPSATAKDGLARMSSSVLDVEEVKSTITSDQTLSTLVKKFDGTIKYCNYTITAEITKDGKLVSVTHKGVASVNAVISAAGLEDLNLTTSIEFNENYTDFKY